MKHNAMMSLVFGLLFTAGALITCNIDAIDPQFKLIEQDEDVTVPLAQACAPAVTYVTAPMIQRENVVNAWVKKGSENIGTWHNGELIDDPFIIVAEDMGYPIDSVCSEVMIMGTTTFFVGRIYVSDTLDYDYGEHWAVIDTIDPITGDIHCCMAPIFYQQ